MCKYRGRIFSKQYMVQKLSKYGIKLYMLYLSNCTSGMFIFFVGRVICHWYCECFIKRLVWERTHFLHFICKWDGKRRFCSGGTTNKNRKVYLWHWKILLLNRENRYTDAEVIVCWKTNEMITWSVPDTMLKCSHM